MPIKVFFLILKYLEVFFNHVLNTITGAIVRNLQIHTLRMVF